MMKKQSIFTLFCILSSILILASENDRPLSTPKQRPTGIKTPKACTAKSLPVQTPRHQAPVDQTNETESLLQDSSGTLEEAKNNRNLFLARLREHSKSSEKGEDLLDLFGIMACLTGTVGNIVVLQYVPNGVDATYDPSSAAASNRVFGVNIEHDLSRKFLMQQLKYYWPKK